jgi:hypothetical protein
VGAALDEVAAGVGVDSEALASAGKAAGFLDDFCFFCFFCTREKRQ